ncbi:DUF1778 domain-containing protein [Actinomadura atramentaria]|uniref:type II toxin-antitoxin system TacA family antitoxin n=1 Tax=Actinomadura atramentaria TaxID=1990 RepID=UPI000369A3CC|nr:DUF1778 domain-containing protein [Actinomadura atramentaria]
MPESVPAPRSESVEFRISPEQHLVLHEAAALLGWTVAEYVLSTALDRAERDLHTHAATIAPPLPDPDLTPFTVFLTMNT